MALSVSFPSITVRDSLLFQYKSQIWDIKKNGTETRDNIK